MKHALKFGRLRALQDPDRAGRQRGVYYGTNVPNALSLPRELLPETVGRVRTTRGACA